MNILAVFRSRAQALAFAEALKKRGVPARIVPTPKQAKTGCGLSCQFPFASLAAARSALSGGHFSSFAGFYRLSFTSHGTALTPYFN